MSTDPASVSATELAPDLTPDDYVVLGMAACFVREEKDLHPVVVLEPIPSAMMEALDRGVPTSYQWVLATTIGAIWRDGHPQRLPQCPEVAQFCDDFGQRVAAAARTYKARPAAQALVPPGARRDNLNYSTERKRILNLERQVNTADNVKQHSHTHKIL